MDAADKSLIPFCVSGKITNGQSMGRGVLLIVTVGTASADVTVKHALGRIPSFVLILDPGTVFVNWKRGTVAWTTNKLTLQFSATGTFLIWVV